MSRNPFVERRIASLFEKRLAILAVPYEEKDEADKLGAVWYDKLKVWFVPEGSDIEQFSRWNGNGIAATNVLQDAEHEFVNLMQEYNLDTGKELIPDGKWHNVSVTDHYKDKNLSGAYLFHPSGGKYGQPTGYVKNMYSGIAEHYSYRGNQDSLARESKLRAENLLQNMVLNAERVNQHEKVAKNAAGLLALAVPSEDFLYLKNKKISYAAARQVSGKNVLEFEEFRYEEKQIFRPEENYLVLPMQDETGQTRSLQLIDKTGKIKSFMRGGQKSGSMLVLGAQCLNELIDSKMAVTYVEGYATGLSFHMATGISVVVCFDADNLEKIVLQHGNRFDAEVPQFVGIDNDQFFPERSMEFIKKKLDLENLPEGDSSIQVRTGRGVMRKVEVGGICCDGEWHELGTGQYNVKLEYSHAGETVRTLQVEIKNQSKSVKGNFSNRGLEAGLMACEFLKDEGRTPKILTPEFKSLDKLPTDWNDMHRLEGLKSIQHLLQSRYNIDVKKISKDNVAELFKAKSTISR